MGTQAMGPNAGEPTTVYVIQTYFIGQWDDTACPQLADREDAVRQFRSFCGHHGRPSRLIRRTVEVVEVDEQPWGRDRESE